MADVTFTERAFGEYIMWQSEDRKTLKRINALLRDIPQRLSVYKIRKRR